VAQKPLLTFESCQKQRSDELMGGLLCRSVCCRKAENGDALDSLTSEERALRLEKMTYSERAVAEFLTCDTTVPCKTNMYLKFMDWMTVRGYPKVDPGDGHVIRFDVAPSPIVKGIYLLVPTDSADGLDNVRKALSGGKKVIVGSVRMGYGHHRIAYSALTWAMELGMEPYLMDILAPDCTEAEIIRNMDKTYSKMSRWASQQGGLADHIWGKMMLQGDINALRLTIMMAERIQSILAGLPKDVPIITSYPLVGNMAVACGFKKVINLIFDNYPQYFVLVPGAINLVQSPSYFDKLLDMGVPTSHLSVAGHWVSSELCKHLEDDCHARIKRCEKQCPRRFLIAVGGAGAQLGFLKDLMDGLRANLLAGKLRLYINCGDHGHIAVGLLKKLEDLGLPFNHVTTNDAAEKVCSSEPLSGISEPAGAAPITVFHFDDHFTAFRCTDLVCRIADVLVTKPSELAFFPIPKLHIRRVGAHEAFSADRASEIGDGSVECRTVEHTLQKVAQLNEPNSPLFKLMNECVLKAGQIKTYEGSRVACEYALSSS